VLTVRGSFTTLAASLQGAVTSIIGSAVDQTRIRQDSLYNDSTKIFYRGPMEPSGWERMQAFASVFPPVFRIIGGSLYILPIPTAGQTVYLDYASKNWATSSGGTGQAKFLADTDLCVFDDDLMIVGLVYLIKRALGQDFVTQELDFERMLFALASQEQGGKPAINAGGPVYQMPSATVPDGSWNVS
jgi:hypothetical protein